MFWNLFGMSEVSDLAVTGSGFFITQVTGELLLALFSIVSVLVAMNMLIAMMSNSYQQVVVSLVFMVECFPFNKISGLKFRKFNYPDGTVRSGSTDTTQAPERLVFVLKRRIQRSGTGDNNFVTDRGNQSGLPSKVVPNIPVQPNPEMDRSI